MNSHVISYLTKFETRGIVIKLQSWNFLIHLEIHLLVSKFGIFMVWLLGSLASHCNGFPSASLKWQDAYGCYDANMETKSGKILRIFRYQVRAVTYFPEDVRGRRHLQP